MGKETTNIVSGFLETFVRLSSYQVIDAVLLFVGGDRKNRIDGRKYGFWVEKEKRPTLGCGKDCSTGFASVAIQLCGSD